ncbi:MAG: MTAP family purine nucleoside phosphorylase [Desulfovibrionaceae bacterium]|nr:MTAP family purine nucleoside phosphorylase [Desulfovibrionaceae bacterium]
MGKCIGVIGGSGLDNPDLFEPEADLVCETAWGAPSSPLLKGRLKGTDIEIVMLARHGREHAIPPHRVNHRANIAALQEAGCSAVLATTACGSLREDLSPGSLVVPDQFVDFTRNPMTYFDSFAGVGMQHTVMADPFDASLRRALLDSAAECGFKAADGATVVSIAGPRFSTRAESRMFRTLGCDIINMTVAPECILANEKKLPYAAIAMVTDYDCWNVDHPALDIDEILRVMAENVDHILQILLKTFPKI